MIDVMLVDDQPLVRAGLGRILSVEEGFAIAAECADGAEALAALDHAHVDVILMDVRMKGMNGIDATRQVRSRGGPPVLILTTFDDDDALWGAIEAGAAGFVLKEATAEQLIAAAKAVASGGSWLDPVVTPRILSAYRQTVVPRLRAAASAAQLTDRELDVLKEMSTGASNTEIAARLFVSEATVKTHVSAIFMKLGVRDRAGAIVFAYQNGIAPR